jgi:hypothetical protein
MSDYFLIREDDIFFKELTLTTFYGDAICFEAYGFNAYSLDVLKKNDGTRGSQRGTLGSSTGEYRASINRVNYRWQTKT